MSFQIRSESPFSAGDAKPIESRTESEGNPGRKCQCNEDGFEIEASCDLHGTYGSISFSDLIEMERSRPRAQTKLKIESIAPGRKTVEAWLDRFELGEE